MVENFEPGVFFGDWSPHPVGPEIDVRKRNDDVEVGVTFSGTEGKTGDVLTASEDQGALFQRYASNAEVTIAFSKPTEVSSVRLMFKEGFAPSSVRTWQTWGARARLCGRGGSHVFVAATGQSKGTVPDARGQ